MNTDHLTFGQLLKLSSLSNLGRLTERYHCILHTLWDQKRPGRQWFVKPSEELFPAVSRRYQRVLAFVRGPALRRRLRLAAAEQPVPVLPGSNRVIRDFETVANALTAYQLAFIGRAFCGLLGVPARVERTQNAFQLRADTNGLGVAVLRYHPGVTVGSLRQFCADDRTMKFEDIFWYVPASTPDDVLLNPLLRCLNTPDMAENAREIFFNPDEA